VGMLASASTTMGGPDALAFELAVVACTGATFEGSANGTSNIYTRVVMIASENPKMITETSDLDRFSNSALMATKDSSITDGTTTGTPLDANQIFMAACESCDVGGTAMGTGIFRNRAVIGGSGLSGDLCGDDSLTTNNLCVNNITLNDGANIAVGTVTGTTLGTTAAEKIGLWGAAPVVQHATNGSVAGFAFPPLGNALDDNSSTTGGLGTKCYTLADVVLALKQMGVLAQS